MEVDTTTWIVGFVVGGVVALVVVVVVLAITAYATRIRDQVDQIVAALRDAHRNTDALWEVQDTSRVAQDVLHAAQHVRRDRGG